VLVTSSIASLMPGAYQAVYNASKSFLQSFAQALQSELAGTGVTVTALLPGPTETRFFERAGMADNTLVGRGSKDDPAQVAADGFEALMSGRRRVVAGGFATKAQYVAGMVLPDPVKAALHSVMAKPRKHAA
jgi:short-subunit dehydrogenase